MKKINLLLLGFVFIVSIFIVACSSNDTVKNDEMIISVDYSNEHNISGMGLDYKLKNIKPGKYNISLYSKEFSKGKFVKNQDLYNTTLDLKKKMDEYNISIYQENEEIKLLTGESEWNNITLDFFDKNISGRALFQLETDKKIELNKDLPIAGYIVGDNVKDIKDSNIDTISNHNADNEIVIYLKITNI